MGDCGICEAKDVGEDKCNWCSKIICRTCTSGRKYVPGAGTILICKNCFKNGFSQAEFQRMR